MKNTENLHITHSFNLRIYYEDTDAQGIVYHANYIKYLERARTEMLRETGHNQSELTAETGEYFVLGELNARYKAPAKLDDALIVETTILNIGSASMKLQQNVLKQVASDKSLLLEGVVTLIYVSKNGRPVRIPENLRNAFAPYIVQEEA